MSSKIILKNHQASAVESAVSLLSSSDRCKVIMACGTGKTFVAPSIACLLSAKSIVIYLPSIALVRQTLREWLKVPLPSMRCLCVCSDSTVSRGDDSVSVTSDDLRNEFGRAIVTTSSNIVGEFLTKDSASASVIFTTYHSGDVVADGCPDGFWFDIGFFDEAHNTAGKKEKLFSLPLLDSHTRMRKRVFLTATPKHLSYQVKRGNRKRTETEPKVLYSMDNEIMYGKDAYNLSIRDAIRQGIISDYRVLISVITDDRLPPNLLLNKDAETVAHSIAIKDAIEKYGVKKIVTFHNTVDEAKSFSDGPVKNEIGIGAFHVNGNMSSASRDKVLNDFRDADFGLITNSRCLTEGVDVPEIDMVAFLHPKDSKIDIIQAIGRALRKGASNNNISYILLPIYRPRVKLRPSGRRCKRESA